jgi:hypothetical protein
LVQLAKLARARIRGGFLNGTGGLLSAIRDTREVANAGRKPNAIGIGSNDFLNSPKAVLNG